MVRDTGTGIKHAELPHIFERFHRIENARARTHEGGIGLALIRISGTNQLPKPPIRAGITGEKVIVSGGP